jgi:hypothetical protein
MSGRTLYWTSLWTSATVPINLTAWTHGSYADKREEKPRATVATPDIVINILISDLLRLRSTQMFFIAEPPKASVPPSAAIAPICGAGTVISIMTAMKIGLTVPIILNPPVNVYSHLHVELIQKRKF